jgi:hypothetical protein
MAGLIHIVAGPVHARKGYHIYAIVRISDGRCIVDASVYPPDPKIPVAPAKADPDFRCILIIARDDHGPITIEEAEKALEPDAAPAKGAAPPAPDPSVQGGGAIVPTAPKTSDPQSFKL